MTDDPYRPPTSASVNPVQDTSGDATGGLIPYKNAPALLAYYLGLFSLFPCLGFFLAVPALVLGLMGLAKRRQNPAVRGSVHAWIGIIMGGIFTIVWGALLIVMLIGFFSPSDS